MTEQLKQRMREILAAEYRKLDAPHYADMVPANEPPVQVTAAIAAMLAARNEALLEAVAVCETWKKIHVSESAEATANGFKENAEFLRGAAQLEHNLAVKIRALKDKP